MDVVHFSPTPELPQPNVVKGRRTGARCRGRRGGAEKERGAQWGEVSMEKGGLRRGGTQVVGNVARHGCEEVRCVLVATMTSIAQTAGTQKPSSVCPEKGSSKLIDTIGKFVLFRENKKKNDL
jgi:hypothetical protein